MNFLAHAFLSFENPELMVGNFIADFVKGNDYLNYPDPVSNGIILHREIDQFTDEHRQFRHSKRRLHQDYGHYSGVIVDMYFDHFLAANFFKFHKKPLSTFSLDVYQTVQSYPGAVPSNAEKILFYMSKGNWLFSYRQIAGIEQALKGVGRRTRFKSGLEFAGGTLRQHYWLFYQDFMIFFPKAIAFAQSKILEL
ncbi:MAG: ACP phosphodiesterase [Cyclobacteriaceae bacterium]|nr:MAG: ACP phosphodiesterase [Cyclobacteriaceae bacterium]